MTNNLRFILDTSVIVSAVLLPHSLPRQAFDLAFIQGTVLVSDATLNELDEVLRRPRFDRYIAQEDRLKFLATFMEDSIVIEVTEVITDCRDSKDNKFLELSVSGKATSIISGDDDLLSLNPFRGISIVTPQVFVSEYSYYR